MSQSIVAVIVFLGVLVCMPWLIRLLKDRVASTGKLTDAQSRVVSAVAVGPHQRIVTVEVGPENGRVWLVLGVTPQTITCLHSSSGLKKTSDRNEIPVGGNEFS